MEAGGGSAGQFKVRLHVPPAHAAAEPAADAGETEPLPPPSVEERFGEWVALLNPLLQSRTRRAALARAHEKERTANDEAERPDGVVRVPLFPEASGAWLFVRILDHQAGESLFTADDGPRCG